MVVGDDAVIAAELDILTGRLQEAVSRLEELAAAEITFPPYTKMVLAWALLEEGETERASQVLADALHGARMGRTTSTWSRRCGYTEYPMSRAPSRKP